MFQIFYADFGVQFIASMVVSGVAMKAVIK